MRRSARTERPLSLSRVERNHSKPRQSIDSIRGNGRTKPQEEPAVRCTLLSKRIPLRRGSAWKEELEKLPAERASA